MRILAILVLAGLLAGCGGGPDPGRALLCRATLPALHPEGSRIDLRREIAEPEGVALAYDVAEPGAAVRRARVLCLFEGDPRGPGGRTLRGLVADEAALSPMRLFLLERYWLADRAAAFAQAPPAPSPLAGDGVALSAAGVRLVQVIVAALTVGTLYGLLAVAYSLVYGLVGRVFLAFGEIAVFGGYGAAIAVIAAIATSGLGHDPAVIAGLAVGAVAAPLLACALARVAGASLAAPLAHRPGQAMIVASFGLAIALSEFLRLAQGSSELWVPPGRLRGLVLATNPDGGTATITAVQAACIAIAVLAALGAMAMLRATRFGRAWRAVADDAGAAALLGVDPRRVLVGAFALAGALAGLSGWIIVAQYGVIGFSAGLVLGLKALVAAVLGGVGSLPGALVGGLLLGFGESLWSAYLPGAYRDVAVFAALSVVLALRPGGLFGDAHPGLRPV